MPLYEASKGGVEFPTIVCWGIETRKRPNRSSGGGRVKLLAGFLLDFCACCVAPLTAVLAFLESYESFD